MKQKAFALLLAMVLLAASSGCRPTYNGNSPATQTTPEGDNGQYDSDYGTTGDSDLSNAGSATNPTVAETDQAKLGGLSASSKDWGPGGPRDAQNRSQGALQYNKLYGKYNALFLAESSEKVYLTFDEGYEYGLTGNILDTLKAKNVKAIFFVTRDFAKAEPALIQRMIDEGHVVGNHSWTHKNYSTFTPSQAQADLGQLDSYIKENFNYQMKYFRFPSGNFSEQTLAAVQQAGYKSVFWSFAYKDWLVDSQPEASASLQKIVDAACPGQIYLLHAVSKTNAAILGQVIDSVAAKGFVWGDPNEL